MDRTSDLRHTLGLLVLVTIPAISFAQNPFTLSEKDEIELGRLAAGEIEKDILLIEDPAVVKYIDDLGQSLVQKSTRKGITYTFKVVDSPEINAFALPGGFIYVNRGLIEAAETQDELAGVLAHEIGHVVARHGADQAVRAGLVQTGLGALGGLLGRGTSSYYRQDRRRDGRHRRLHEVQPPGRARGRPPRRAHALRRQPAAAGHGQLLREACRPPEEPAQRSPEVLLIAPQPRRAIEQRLHPDCRLPREFQGRLPILRLSATSRSSWPPCPALKLKRPRRRPPLPPRLDHPPNRKPDVRSRNMVRDRDIAARFAPIFHQALGPAPRFDYITNFDFDGDWRGDNNWNNAADRRYPLKAYVYYAVFESRTHFFIHYAAFHPRDYKGGEKRGALLSEAMRTGVSLGGQYDPTGRSSEAVMAHENDLEGALVVAEKNGEDYTQGAAHSRRNPGPQQLPQVRAARKLALRRSGHGGGRPAPLVCRAERARD